MKGTESTPEAPEAAIEKEKAVLAEEPNVVETEASEAPIEEARSIEIPPEASEAPIEEKGAEVAPEAPEAPEAPIEETTSVESVPEAREASIEDEKAALAKEPDAMESEALKP